MKPARGNSLPPVVDHALGLAALLLAWHVYVTTTGVPAFLLPSPASVGGALADLAAGTLWRDLGFTMGNIIVGLVIGSAMGLALGFLLARSPILEAWLEGPILLLQTAPKIALAPLFVIWFGFGPASKIVLIVSLVVFPMLVGTLVGLRSVEPAMLDLARILKLTPWQRLTRIELPAAAPEIFAGLRVGAVQAVVGAILGEWMSGKLGLGHLMTFASATYKTPLLFAAVLLTIAVGMAMHLFVEALEHRILRWKP